MIGDRGSGALKRQVLRRRIGAALALSAVVLIGAGCSSAPPDRAQVVRALRTSGIPAAQARCTADAIYDNLTDEQVRQLVERGNGGTPKDNPTRTDDALDKLNAAMVTCRDLGSPTTSAPVPGGSATTTADGASLDTTPDEASTTTAPPVGSTDPPSPSSTTLPASSTSD